MPPFILILRIVAIAIPAIIAIHKALGDHPPLR